MADETPWGYCTNGFVVVVVVVVVRLRLQIIDSHHHGWMESDSYHCNSRYRLCSINAQLIRQVTCLDHCAPIFVPKTTSILESVSPLCLIKKIYDGEWRERTVILKVNMSWFKEFEERQNITDSDAVSSYQTDVSSRVKTLFGDCPQCSKLASLLLSLGDGDGDGAVTASEARTFISLLQHVEPMMLMVLNESKHTVDFYGYCGGLYVVEKVPSVASDMFKDTWELMELSFLPDSFEPLQDFFNDYAGKFLNVAAFYMLYVNTIFNNALPVANFPIVSTYFQFHVTSKREKFDFAYSLLDATLGVSITPYGFDTVV
ncbi:Family with sequence similarity 69 member A [Desmophyllum pertusum]|uniref:Family with sequence similarity 69 member A n=1 Tax=Desmophyllum pertusum TaxID=174260 RepID=A0A9X0D9H5_9CNID|nr:Family with sequence similarity 69 member A [Desmophyllum pertusum]